MEIRIDVETENERWLKIEGAEQTTSLIKMEYRKEITDNDYVEENGDREVPDRMTLQKMAVCLLTVTSAQQYSTSHHITE